MSHAPGKIRIERLTKAHDRTSFDCGNVFLNSYLKQFARQNAAKGVARAYVAVPAGGEGSAIMGYYTLSAASIGFEQVPLSLRRRLPRYPVPTARLGELAVNGEHQGQGLGSILLLDAFNRIDSIADELAVWAIVVDPIDDAAQAFYHHFGFEPLADNKSSLFLTLKDLRAWV
ncbi:hypothetical protein MNBD_GAMMA19-2015 [hydrothermal vent metagenome]|uniref:N-acetyltransferase domain-containing protein n=1 Tax=hydrothermal vent metagenome TaxID=652676 RepID=A0A3B1BED9_9ZZZZ